MDTNYTQDRKGKILDYIKLLNEMGFTLVSIDYSFYSITDFDPQDPSSNVFEHTLYGRDITTLVENAVDNVSISEHRKREIITNINNKTQVRRRFHKDIKYVVYASRV